MNTLVNLREGAALPCPRGALTELLCTSLRRPTRSLSSFDPPDDDEDATLALYVLYELHYGGFAEVDDSWEWEPSLLRLRAELETKFESELRAATNCVRAGEYGPREVLDELDEIASKDGPSLSSWIGGCGTLREMREFAIHRSAYQLKEADPHTWAVPRLRGIAKAKMVEIQYGEYGAGVPGAMHAELFAKTMRELDLAPAYGAYVDAIPAVTLRTVNLVSMFGLHRRLRGALVGHLALFEMCSVGPMSRYAAMVRRLGLEHAAPFYDVHVAADEQHAVIARTMVETLVDDEPALAADVIFGARALDFTEANFASYLIDCWTHDRCSLRSC